MGGSYRKGKDVGIWFGMGFLGGWILALVEFDISEKIDWEEGVGV